MLYILEVEMCWLDWTLRLMIGDNRNDATSWTGLLGQHPWVNKFFFGVHHKKRGYLLLSSLLPSLLSHLTYLVIFKWLPSLIWSLVVFITESVLIIIIICCLNNRVLTSLSWPLKIALASLVVWIKWKLTLMVLFLHLTFWTLVQFTNRWKKLRWCLTLYMMKVLLLLVRHLFNVKPVFYGFFHKFFIFLVWHEFFLKTLLADDRVCLQYLFHDSHVLRVYLFSLLFLKGQREWSDRWKIRRYHILMNEGAVADVFL